MVNKVFYFLYFYFCAAAIWAHPHLYSDLSLSLDMETNGIKGFTQEWTLLRTFGQQIITLYDTDGSGFFDEEETEKIKRELFDNIEKYHFYTYLEVGSRTYFPETIQNFSVRIRGDQTVFCFYVPCEIQTSSRYSTIVLSIYDPSRYVSFGLLYIDDPVQEGVEYKVEIFRDSNVYSHSNMRGNAIIEIGMKKLSDNPGVPESFCMENLIPLDNTNRGPENTIRNPFLDEGRRMNDGTANPFLTN